MRFLRDTAEMSAARAGRRGREEQRKHDGRTRRWTRRAALSRKRRQTIDERLKSFVRAVDEMAAYAAYLYEHPDRFIAHPVPTPDELAAAGSRPRPDAPLPARDKGHHRPPRRGGERAAGQSGGPCSPRVLSNTPEISSVYTAHESGANIGYDQFASLKAGIGAFDCRIWTGMWRQAHRQALRLRNLPGQLRPRPDGHDGAPIR